MAAVQVAKRRYQCHCAEECIGNIEEFECTACENGYYGRYCQNVHKRLTGFHIEVDNVTCYQWTNASSPPTIFQVNCIQQGRRITVSLPPGRDYNNGVLTLCEIQHAVVDIGVHLVRGVAIVRREIRAIKPQATVKLAKLDMNRHYVWHAVLDIGVHRVRSVAIASLEIRVIKRQDIVRIVKLNMSHHCVRLAVKAGGVHLVRSVASVSLEISAIKLPDIVSSVKQDGRYHDAQVVKILVTGCDAGWKDDTCKTACEMGAYGINCNETCGNCRYGNTSCAIKDGVCSEGCSAGWMNSTCKIPCELGTYGTNCRETCGDCRDGNTTCDRTDGVCNEGCSAGWMDSTCKLVCDYGRYGEDCKDVCENCKDGHCDVVIGCTEHLDDGHVGISAGVSVAVVLIVASTAMGVFFWRSVIRRQKRKHGSDRPKPDNSDLVNDVGYEDVRTVTNLTAFNTGNNVMLSETQGQIVHQQHSPHDDLNNGGYINEEQDEPDEYEKTRHIHRYNFSKQISTDL
ncbi:uncharacterized protein LOC121367356 [Gigantopelta aegis]|uniref:uncharacterized protein LOC121367356 n=1 Tax=Gigantopelta aegis TaxID=1735272 RepID=UPI001B88B58D|nr:uncharacterized protein LOC121367356 [Gigantopelta aegis]